MDERKTGNMVLVTGDTYQYRGFFRKCGWNWNGAQRAWQPTKVEWQEDPNDTARGVLQEIRSINGIRNRGNFVVTVYEDWYPVAEVKG